MNVSRHLPDLWEKGVDGELPWDVVVLHYIGLDHIGHSHAADGTLIADKLHQMDEVVRQLHTGLKEQVSLCSNASSRIAVVFRSTLTLVGHNDNW